MTAGEFRMWLYGLAEGDEIGVYSAVDGSFIKKTKIIGIRRARNIEILVFISPLYATYFGASGRQLKNGNQELLYRIAPAPPVA